MKIPENPYRKALANMYIEQNMGGPEEGTIKKAVNGSDGEERSLDYYIACERMLGHAIHVFKDIDKKQLGSAGFMFAAMVRYVSYEIERLSTFENEG